MDYIPPNFLQRYGASSSWITSLPALQAHCERHWDIRVGLPIEPLTYNYVAYAKRVDGTPVILKIHAPTPPFLRFAVPTDEFVLETEALRHFDGNGMVRMLDYDPESRAILLEHVQPGLPLSRVENKEQEISIACTIMRQMWSPLPREHSFPSVQDLGRVFRHLREHYRDRPCPIPGALVEEAELLFAELNSSMTLPVLLHGDLHPQNILAGGPTRWVAIDPVGLIGDPIYEIWGLLRSLLPPLRDQMEPDRALTRQVDQFASELNLDRVRIRNCCLVQSVLACWRCIEAYGEQFQESNSYQNNFIYAQLLTNIKA